METRSRLVALSSPCDGFTSELQLKLFTCSMSSQCGGQTIRTIDTDVNFNTAATTVAYSTTNQLIVGYVSNAQLRAVSCTSASGGCRASVLLDTAASMTANVDAAFGPDDGLPVLAYGDSGSVRMAQCTDASCVQYATSTVDQSPLDSEALPAGRLTVIPDVGDFFTFTPQRKPLLGYRASIAQSGGRRLDLLAFVTCGSCGLDDNNNGIGDDCESPTAPPTLPPTTRPTIRPTAPPMNPTNLPTRPPTRGVGCSDANPCSNGGACDDGACTCVPRDATDGSADRVCFSGVRCTFEVSGCPSSTVACNADTGAGTTVDTCVAGISETDASSGDENEDDDDSGMSSGVVILIVFLILGCTAGCIAGVMFYYKGRKPAEKVMVLSSVNPGFQMTQQRNSVVPGAQGYLEVGADVDERHAAPGGVYGEIRKPGGPRANKTSTYNHLDQNLDDFENYDMTDPNNGYTYEEPTAVGLYEMATGGGNSSKVASLQNAATGKGGKKGGGKSKQPEQQTYAMGDGTSDGVRGPKKRSAKGAKKQPEQPMYAMGDGASDGVVVQVQKQQQQPEQQMYAMGDGTSDGVRDERDPNMQDGVYDTPAAPAAKAKKRKQPAQAMYAMGDGTSDGIRGPKKRSAKGAKKQPEQPLYAMGDGASDNVVAKKKSVGPPKADALYAMGDGISDGVVEQPMYAMGDGASDGIVVQKKKKKDTKKKQPTKMPAQLMYAMGDGTSDGVIVTTPAKKKKTGAAEKAQADPTYDLGGFGSAGPRTDETPIKGQQMTSSVYDFDGMDSPYDSRTVPGTNSLQVGPGAGTVAR